MQVKDFAILGKSFAYKLLEIGSINMIKLYIIIIFSGLTFFCQGQTGRNGEINFTSDNGQSNAIKPYPNPASSIINFEFSKPVQRNYILQVFNFLGKKVFESNAVSQKISVPVADLYRGIYIFQLRDQMGRIVESGKFQVSR